MLARYCLLFLLALSQAAASGCLLFEKVPAMTRESLRALRMRPSDYRDLTEEEDHEWDFVGTEARGNQPRETDPDPPWLRNLLTSEKARAIERNLGVD